MKQSKKFYNKEESDNVANIPHKKSIKYENFAESTPLLKQKECYLPKRYVFVFLGFLGMFNVYSMRVNLSVAMVAMVNLTENSLNNISQHHQAECPGLVNVEDKNRTKEYKGEQYNWDTKTQGAILGAFFYGYIITQIPGGILSEKFGSKWFFGGGIMVTSVLSLITPLAAGWGTAALIAVRVIEGFGEGVTFPAINLAIGKWSPKYQRSRLSTIIFSGNQVGNVIAMPISGILCSLNFLGGWPSVFYVFGGIGCLWFFLWSLIMRESPATHPSISAEELKLIEESREEKMVL